MDRPSELRATAQKYSPAQVTTGHLGTPATRQLRRAEQRKERKEIERTVKAWRIEGKGNKPPMTLPQIVEARLNSSDPEHRRLARLIQRQVVGRG